MQSSITKMGLWGGAGGWDHEITAPPKRLQSLTITTRSGSAVESIQFTYTDKAGEKHTAGPWGGSGGTSQTVSEFFPLGLHYILLINLVYQQIVANQYNNENIYDASITEMVAKHYLLNFSLPHSSSECY